jgi:hypothetical protein
VSKKASARRIFVGVNDNEGDAMSSKRLARTYTRFVACTATSWTATEFSRVCEHSHDEITRWLASSRAQPAQLWSQAAPLIRGRRGWLIADDCVISKAHGRHIELADWHYSSTIGKPVWGMCVVVLVWTDGRVRIPIDYRIFTKSGPNKHKLLRSMLTSAKKRGIKPDFVVFDSWYASVETLLFITRELG